jgi:hypothetical protein
MKRDGECPAVGRGAELLGVRVGGSTKEDIPVEDGMVEPGTGGMSVSPRPEALPSHRLPRRLRDKYPDRFPKAAGSASLHCWSLGEGPFLAASVVERLSLRLDPDHPEKHGFVEPDQRMALSDYEAALAATQPVWHRWEE